MPHPCAAACAAGVPRNGRLKSRRLPPIAPWPSARMRHAPVLASPRTSPCAQGEATGAKQRPLAGGARVATLARSVRRGRRVPPAAAPEASRKPTRLCESRAGARSDRGSVRPSRAACAASVCMGWADRHSPRARPARARASAGIGRAQARRANALLQAQCEQHWAGATWRGASAVGAARRAVRTQALASSSAIRASVRITPPAAARKAGRPDTPVQRAHSSEVLGRA